MCGIVGIVSNAAVAKRLLAGLKQLEYRGYDSSGIATVSNNTIHRARAKGKLNNLENSLSETPIDGAVGIGHTRWATHGLPTEVNAHPHATENVALVHNGIIENFRALKLELEKSGISFSSQTDTEVIVHLIDQQLQKGKTPQEAVRTTLKKLKGAFALGIIFAHHPNMLIAARRGSPLAVGYGDSEMFIGSDAIALAPFTSKIAYMEDGDWAVIDRHGAKFYDETDHEVTRQIKTSSVSAAITGKGDFAHYMLKEIYEQPTVVGETINVFCHFDTGQISLPSLPFDLKTIDSITIVACGTSYYAGLIASYWLEGLAGVPTHCDVASEYRYRNVPSVPNTLAMFISQSGETADTLAAMRAAKKAGKHCIAIVNVPESTMANEADAVIHTYAGLEIGVASTKAFLTQLTTLACFAIKFGEEKGSLGTEEKTRLIHTLSQLPSHIVEILHHEDRIKKIALNISHARSVLYMGRGSSHVVALEGALKLKEISYIHAEGYPAGEFKHGPLALIDEHVPVIVIAPSDELFEKTASNVQEIVARQGKVVLISDVKGINMLGDIVMDTIEMPTADPFIAPILYTLPVQLLAYYVAVFKGTDIDQPRNLAKSVTVE